MRFFGILGVSAAALVSVLTAACGDDKAGPIVNDDISWHIGCASASGCGIYAAHVQEEVNQNFRVSCSRSKTSGYSITLTDPGFRGDGVEPARPPSSIIIENADPASQSCNVTVREASDYNFAQETWTGSCARSGGTCEFTGGPKDGWDFVGVLNCPALTKRATGTNAVYRLEIGAGDNPNGPVQLAVDNCG